MVIPIKIQQSNGPEKPNRDQYSVPQNELSNPFARKQYMCY
jgi:hypothetical protein